MTVERTLKHGIYSPVPTFYEEDGYTLDLETQVAHAKMLFDAGISGLLIGGSTGEAVSLTLAERCETISAVHRAFPGFTIMAGGVGSSIGELSAQAQAYKEAGASSMIVLVPGYYGPAITKQQGLVDWFHSLAEKSALPIVVYNYPGVQNGIDLSIDSFTAIGAHKNIVGCKLTNFNFPLYTMLGQSEQLAKSDFTPLSGVGQVLVPSLSVGVNGAIDGVSNVFPKCLIEITKLFSKGRIEEAAKLQDLVTKANEMTAATNLLGLKYALKYRYGFGKTLVGRPPLNIDMDVSLWKKYQAVYDKLGEIEDSL